MQARVLSFVVRTGRDNEVFQKEIEEEFNLRRSTVTGIVKLMEEKGLITRTVYKIDARVKKVRLTEKGIDLEKNLFKDIIDYDKMLTKNLTDEELDNLEKIIKKINFNLEEHFKEDI